MPKENDRPSTVQIDLEWALRELAEGWISNDEREGPYGFYQNARRVLTLIANDAAQLQREVDADRWAIRELYGLPHEGDLYEQLARYLEHDTVSEVRLQNAVWNLLSEPFYEEGIKNNGVAVKFLMRLHLLACEAGLPEYSKNNPVVAEAIAALGDPAENSPESLKAAWIRAAQQQ